MVDVSIIIISYNTREMTLACLRSIFEQTKDITFEVIVVDNNSSDFSSQAIEKSFSNVDLIKSKENIGFAGANNLASQKANGHYLLLLNPDTVVLDEAVQKLHGFAIAHPDNLVYGGRTLYGDLSLNPTSCWKRPTLWSLFCYSTGLTSILRNSYIFDNESYGDWKRNTVRKVDIITGCFLMIEQELWRRLDGFEEDFFMYGEDADLCFRARKEGAIPIITPDATIIHYCGASEKVRADKMIRFFRAKEQLFKKHWMPFNAWIGASMLRISVIFRVCTFRIFALSGVKKYNNSFEIWSEIWRRRKEWYTN